MQQHFLRIAALTIAVHRVEPDLPRRDGGLVDEIPLAQFLLEPGGGLHDAHLLLLDAPHDLEDLLVCALLREPNLLRMGFLPVQKLQARRDRLLGPGGSTSTQFH